MNSKIKDFIHNFSYALSSNLVTMVVSALTVFIIPKFLGVSDYGYWQLFLFYSSYVPFLQFGWTDGIYLRYGGLEKRDLDKKLFFSQFISLLTIQILGLPFLKKVIFLIRENALLTVTRLRNVSTAKVVQL